MNLRRTIITTLSLLVFVASAAAIANAQPQRTFVKTTGNDANNCISTSTPCRTFQAAVNKVKSEGEVVAIDSGGFGSINITKSVTISGTGVSASATSVGAGDAITIALPPGPGPEKVALRDIRVQGLGTGTYGIHVTDIRTLYIQGVTVERFTSHGIYWDHVTTNARLVISDTISRENTSDGLNVEASNRTDVSIDESSFVGNGEDGIDFCDGNIDASVSDSIVSENDQEGLDVSAGPNTEVVVTRTTAANNGTDGFFVNRAELNLDYCTAHHNANDGMAIGNVNGTLRVVRSSATDNTVCGFNNTIAGTFERQQVTMANMVRGNGTNICGTLTNMPTN